MLTGKYPVDLTADAGVKIFEVTRLAVQRCNSPVYSRQKQHWGDFKATHEKI